MLIEIGLFLALGVLVGFIAPAAGIGGGLLMVPAFLIVFSRFGIAPNLAAHLAVGSSVAAATLMSASSMRAHARHGAVEWSVFVLLVPGLMLGAILGGLVAHWLPDTMLHRLFAALMLLVALWLVIGLEPHAHGDSHRPPPWAAVGAGFLIGTVATMVGIGGGAMIVPFLLLFGMASASAVGTSSAAVFATVLTGSIVYMIVGHGVANLPAGAIGYVYGPAVLGTAVTAMLVAPLGARVGRRLPPRLFKRLFALLLVGVAVKLLFF